MCNVYKRVYKILTYILMIVWTREAPGPLLEKKKKRHLQRV